MKWNIEQEKETKLGNEEKLRREAKKKDGRGGRMDGQTDGWTYRLQMD